MKRIAVFLLLLILILPATGKAEALEGEAKTALDQGLAAARAGDWTGAIESFGKARELAPTAPEPLFNLGLAYDKEGKAPLLAAVWFRAYLASAPPPGPRVRQVEERVKALDGKVRDDMARLVDTLRKLLPVMQDQLANVSYFDQKQRREMVDTVRQNLALALLAMGDPAEAFALADQVADPGSYGSGLSTTLAQTANGLASSMLQAGDLPGVMKIAAAILPDAAWGERGDMGKRSSVHLYAVEGLAKAGRFDEASSMALGIEDLWYRYKAYETIAKARIDAQDPADARAALALAVKAAEAAGDRVKAGAWADLAGLQAKAEDRDGAKASLNHVRRAVKAAGLDAPQEYNWNKPVFALVKAEIAVGEFGSARKSVTRYVLAENRDRAFEDLFEAAKKAGTFAEAEGAAAETRDEAKRRDRYLSLAQALIEAGRVDAALNLARHLQAPDQLTDLYLSAAGAEARAGKAERARRLLQQGWDEVARNPDADAAFRAWAWTCAGGVLTRLGDAEEGRAAFQRAEAEASQVIDPPGQASKFFRLRHLAVTRAKAGARADALTNLTQAAEAAAVMPVRQIAAHWLMEVARDQDELGDRAAAARTLALAEQALDADEKAGEITSGHPYRWKQLAEVYAGMGDTAGESRARTRIPHAARLARAARAVEEWSKMADHLAGPKSMSGKYVRDLGGGLRQLDEKPQYDYPGFTTGEMATALGTVAGAFLGVQKKAMEEIAALTP